MKINRTIKQIITCFILIIFLTVSGITYYFMKDDSNITEKAEKNPIGYKLYYKPMPDDWYYMFKMTEAKDENGEIIFIHEMSGYSLKYASSVEYGNDPEYYNAIRPPLKPGDSGIIGEQPDLELSVKFIKNKCENVEIKEIGKYFDNKQFNRDITLDDIKDLELENFNAELIVDLYNNTWKLSLVNEPKESKKFIYINRYFRFRDNFEDGYQWSVPMVVESDVIQLIKLNLKFEDGTYLSDRIKNNNATDEQKKLYETFDEIEKYILEEQDVDFKKMYPEYKGKYYDRLEKSLNEIYLNPHDRKINIWGEL